jgi:hypothetical protein
VGRKGRGNNQLFPYYQKMEPKASPGRKTLKHIDHLGARKKFLHIKV